jgi:uncharacterized protein YjiS (DUF1127 family)
MTMLPLRIPAANEVPVNASVVVPLQTRPVSWRATLREAWRRHRSRLRLVELDDHMLKDIGLSRADVWRECSKPFWQD